MTTEKTDRIGCPLFQEEEQEIKTLTDRINTSKKTVEKAMYAGELLRETDILLECAEYDGARPDCKNCRTIANLRKATAGLIIMAGKLEH